MFIVVRHPLYRLIALGISLAIAAIVYFAVIKPNNDKATNAINQGIQQVQKQVDQNGTSVPPNVKNLVQCLAAAHGDVNLIQPCEAKFR
jgi:hypothetical protein